MDKYAVIGNPVSHSKSPFIQTEFAKQTQQEMEYILLEAPLDGFAQSVRDFYHHGGRGLSVTVPFKVHAVRFVDQLSEAAKLAGAVSVILIKEGGRTYGDNFDGVSLVRDITKNLHYALGGKNILVLGAGGAVRGALLPLLNENPNTLIIANRTVSKAQSLVTEFSKHGELSACGYHELAGKKFDAIINGTSASIDNEVPPLPENLLTDNSLCYDMMYSSEQTVFEKWANKQGAKNIAGGIGMLIEQAADQFYLWRGVRPNTQPIIDLLK